MQTTDGHPRPDEFEVSLFGPGVGESIVVHLGNEDWIVVDSCMDPSTGQPAALGYLERLGVDVAVAVKLIVVTHWHDDHIQGIATILERSPSARIAWSSKYYDQSFFQAITAARNARLDKTGFDEVSRVLQVLDDRRPQYQRIESVGPNWAAEGTVLFRRDPDSNTLGANVMALSPSDATQTLSMHELQGFLPQVGAPQRRKVRVTPNQRSVVLSVEAGQRTALLGADLEDSRNPAVGWTAVVNCPVRSSNRSEIFKVPHHGSKNADNQAVWSQLLTPDPVACLTPFSRGVNPLPTASDIQRLRDRTSRLFSTRPPKAQRPPRRPNVVERAMRTTTLRHRVVDGKLGQIRVRGPLDGSRDLTVDCLGAAQGL